MKRARLIACVFVALAIVALGGCSSNKTDSVAQIRTVDAVSDGGTANIFINNGTANGPLNYFQSSPYLFLRGGQASLQLTLSVVPNKAFIAPSVPITTGNLYTVVAIGRSDVTSSADSRYPTLIVVQDSTAAVPSGSAALRLVNAAPDSTGADLNVDSGAGYVLKSSNIAYGANGGYVILPAGTNTVEVDQAGTNTVLAGPKVFSLASGKQYTVYFVESNDAVPTYDEQLLADAP